MALLPPLLRPSVIARRKAMYSGIFGNSTFWRIVAVVMFGRSFIQRRFGKHSEFIELSKFGAGTEFSIITEKPVPKRKRRKARKAGYEIPTKSDREALAHLWLARQESEKTEILAESKRFWKRF